MNKLNSYVDSYARKMTSSNKPYFIVTPNIFSDQLEIRVGGYNQYVPETMPVGSNRIGEIKIFDIAGRTVQTFSIGVPNDQKSEPIIWTGIDSNGKRVSSGIYFIILKILVYIHF